MALSKKNKLILSWTLPPAFIIASGAAVATTFISLEVKSRSEIDKYPNIIPQSFSSFDDAWLNNLEFNPKKYDFDFFLWNIARSPRVNSVFKFEGAVLNENETAWIKDDVSYSIDPNTMIATQSGSSYTFEFEVIKSARSFSTKYKASTNISSSLFQSKENSRINFLNDATRKINDLFNEGSIKVISNLTFATSPSDFISPDNVSIETSLTSKLASSFSKNVLLGKYTTRDSSFLYESNPEDINSYVNFQIPISGKIFDASDYTIAEDGLISSESKIYQLLKSELESNNLTYLPELTPEESAGVSQENLQRRKIQKLIFDPNKIGFDIVNNHKVPRSKLQAILVKVELNNKSTWIVTWGDLLSVSSELIKRAPELDLEVMRKGNENSTYLVWNELENKDNFKYFKTVTEPTNNLKYEVTSVQFKEDDIAKKNAYVTVKISHPELDDVKTYEKIVTKGFWSKAYKELHDEVSTLTSNFADLSKLSPTVSLKAGVTNNDVINNINNPNWLQRNVIFTKPQGLTKDVQYTVVRAMDLGTKGIQFRLLLSPANDLDANISYNGVAQEIIGTLSSTSKKNNIVFLDS